MPFSGNKRLTRLKFKQLKKAGLIPAVCNSSHELLPWAATATEITEIPSW